MAGKNKLKKFAEITSFPNVLEAFTFEDGLLHINDREMVRMKGQWGADFFGNSGPICLELACGKGEYSIGLAKLHPDRNYIGMDIKGNRIWRGARHALENELSNVGFLRSRIEFINHYFAEDEIAEIWIVFPDPFLRARDENRRLTSIPFLDRYGDLLRNGAKLHLKTDSQELFDFTLETIQEHPQFRLESVIPDVDLSERSPELSIQTFYERKHLRDGKSIKYIRAHFEK